MDLIKEMFNKQMELNNKTAGIGWDKSFSENFISSDKWEKYKIIEACELLESLPNCYHWKKNEADWFNVKVEAIDILFFYLSEAIVCGIGYSEFRGEFKRGLEIDYQDITLDDFIINKIIKNPCIENLGGLFSKLNMSLEDVYKAYMSKHVLNRFRQDHGYKEGKYIKLWDGKEDNVYAFKLAEKCSLDSFEEELYQRLENEYRAS